MGSLGANWEHELRNLDFATGQMFDLEQVIYKLPKPYFLICRTGIQIPNAVCCSKSKVSGLNPDRYSIKCR